MSKTEKKIISLNSPAVPVVKQNRKMVSIKKNIIIGHVSDSTGCGHIRMIFPFTYLNSVFGRDQKLIPIISPLFLKQHDILIRAKSVVFQRQMTDFHKKVVMEYKSIQSKYKFKMIYDMDDLLWGKNEKQGGDIFHGIPTYNFASDIIGDEIKECSIEIMKNMDLITTSTEYLAKYIREELKFDTPIKVIYNTIPIYLYGNMRRQKEIEKIEKPKIMYAGSPTHYSNKKKMKGDMDNAFCDYILKHVKDDSIEFSCMGGLPWFFEEIKNKITVVEWINSYQYPCKMRELEPDFVFMPLIPNEFNYCKSDIKYIESCGIGAIGVGTCFANGKPSPYDNNLAKLLDNCSLKDIENMIDKYTEPDLFNDTVNKQYKMLVDDSRYLESPKYINMLAGTYCGKSNLTK